MDEVDKVLVCLLPDAPVRDEIRQCQQAWQRLGRPTVPARLHLTLLGSMPLHAAQVPHLQRELRHVPVVPFELDLRHCAAWNNGVAALLPAPHDELARLRARIAMAARLAGLDLRGSWSWTPHITLSRSARLAVPPREPPAIGWPVRAFALVRPPAYPAPYERIERYEAAGAATPPAPGPAGSTAVPPAVRCARE